MIRNLEHIKANGTDPKLNNHYQLNWKPLNNKHDRPNQKINDIKRHIPKQPQNLFKTKQGGK